MTLHISACSSKTDMLQQSITFSQIWTEENEDYAHGIKNEKSKNNDIVNHHNHAQHLISQTQTIQ